MKVHARTIGIDCVVKLVLDGLGKDLVPGTFVASGDSVRVVSRRGEIIVAAQISGRGAVPRGRVFVPFFDEAKLVNRVTLDTMDNISKEPDYKKCAVRIERV